MDNGILMALWGGMYVLCCVLGFLPEQTGFSMYVMSAVSLLFFLPPFLLVRKAKAQADHKTLNLLRRISLLSLGLTLILLILNFLTALGTEFLGQVLHYTLVIVSSPMICSGHWAMSLFLWACLLMGSRNQKKHKDC